MKLFDIWRIINYFQSSRYFRQTYQSLFQVANIYSYCRYNFWQNFYKFDERHYPQQKVTKKLARKLKDQELVRLFCNQDETEDVDILQLYDNFLTNEAMMFISTYKWHNLKLLNLNMNKIGDSGCKTFAKMPVHSLKVLHMADNNVSDVGLNYLSKTQFPIIQEIYIGDNCWRQGVTLIAKGKFKKLSCISLSPYGGNQNSKLGYFGCQKLLQNDWSQARCIFLPKFLMSEQQWKEMQEQCKPRFINNTFYCQFC